MHMYLIRRDHDCIVTGLPLYWTETGWNSQVERAQPYADRTAPLPRFGQWVTIGTDPIEALREAVAKAETDVENWQIERRSTGRAADQALSVHRAAQREVNKALGRMRDARAALLDATTPKDEEPDFDLDLD